MFIDCLAWHVQVAALPDLIFRGPSSLRKERALLGCDFLNNTTSKQTNLDCVNLISSSLNTPEVDFARSIRSNELY